MRNRSFPLASLYAPLLVKILPISELLEGTAGKIGLAAIDQSMLSITNFAMNIMIIRCVSKTDYGLYVCGYSLILLANSIQNAVINIQMSIIAPKLGGVQRAAFCSRLAAGQYAMWLPISGAGALGAWALFRIGVLSSHQMIMAVVISAAVPAIFIREFYRSLLLLDFRPLRVLFSDLVYIVIAFSAFLLFEHAFPAKMDILTFVAMGAASMMIGGAGLRGLLRTGRETARGTRTQASFGRCWENGKWALLAVVVTWIQRQSYVYMLLFFKGAENTAEVNAARLMLMPVGLVLISYGRLFMPQWAKDRSAGAGEEVFLSAKKILKYLISGISVYTALLIICKDELIPRLFGRAYLGSSHFILLWGLIFIAQAVRSNFSLVLQVFEKFRYLSMSNFFVMTATVVASAILISLYSDIGSLFAILSGEVLLSLALWFALKGVRS